MSASVRHHRTRQHDRVRASRFTTRRCPRIRRKTTSTARASLMLLISAWLLTILQVTACMFTRNGSPLSAKDSLYVALPRRLRSTQAPLRTTVSRFESSANSSSRTSWFCVRGGPPVRSCRCERVLGFTLAFDATWLHFPCSPLKREVCCTASDGSCFR